MLSFDGMIEDQGTPLLWLFIKTIQNTALADYLAEQARRPGGRARPFGISAKNCIFPSQQQGQMEMSVPVS